ncbi:hypothetical protein [Sphingomonas sp. SORGH_AS_0879]|uniref:hypothetical protein n=1 Tax=Sphingomonas sp. SORGH_AS_0879 TaxID=3041790 RepID=UPI00277F3A89|nr:hypothetical protein [Sphingomonas sp. SORGH_AS_0879]MDQ1229281.1 hypothetical protein [Sphingomonas sp. SORGH_AS_0879]
MAGRTDGLTKNFRAGAAIAPYLILKFGADDQTLLPAAGPTDDLIATSTELAAVQGERFDAALGGLPEVRLGGNVGRGRPITSDAQGRAVEAAPAAGVRVRIIGFSLATGVLGDVVAYRPAPGFITG